MGETEIEKLHLSFWVESATMEKLKALAEKESRPLSNYVRLILENHIENL